MRRFLSVVYSVSRLSKEAFTVLMVCDSRRSRLCKGGVTIRSEHLL